MIRIADIFGGVGGFRRGAELCYGKENVKAVLYCEQDKYAAMSYHANWPLNDDEIYSRDIKEFTDVSNLNNEIAIPDIDILFAGFPCQPFSIMGNQKGFNDDRGNLFFDLVEILKRKKPPYFVLENVSRLINLNGGEYLRAILNTLKSIGYTVTYDKLNSKDYGVPQIRNRVYFTGILNPTSEEQFKLNGSSKIPFISPESHIKYPTTHNLMEKNVDSKYYLSPKLQQTIMSYGTGGWSAKPEINRLIARPLTKTMHKMHRASQDNYFSDDWLNGRLVEVKGEESFQEQGLFPFAKNTQIEYDVIRHEKGKSRIRRITPLEAFRLQGFDDEFVKNAKLAGVSDTRLYMQAGNAVTTTVIASLLQYYLSNIK